MNLTPSQLAALESIETPEGAPVQAPAAFGANLWNRLISAGLAIRHDAGRYAITLDGAVALSKARGA